MKASVELEDLKTTGPLNVKVDTQAPPGVPIVNGFGPGASVGPGTGNTSTPAELNPATGIDCCKVY